MSDPSELSWIVHPLVDSPKRTIVLIAFLIALFTTIQFLFHSIYVTLLSIFFLITSLWSYFVPFRYSLHNDKITISSIWYRVERSWDSFHSCHIDKNGVLLSPFAERSRLESFRGIYIRFRSNRSEVIDFIESKMKEKMNASN